VPRGARTGAVLEILAADYGKEPARNPGNGPLDHLVYGIIAGNAPQRAARAAFEKLRGTFVDWNEMRVAENREILEPLGSLADREVLGNRAELLRRTLQSLFDARDTVRIEFKEPEDAEDVRRALATVPGLSPGLVAAIFAKALPDADGPLSPGVSRVAQRIGLVPRTGGEAKQAAAFDSAAGAGEARVLAHYLLGEHSERVCVPKGPDCGNCRVREHCDFGRRRGAE
jgi:endonuclease III